VWNPPRVLAWNSHKGYLLTLAQAGVAVVPTVLLQAEEASKLEQVVRERGWTEFVAKPAVGADAWRVLRGTSADMEAAREHVQAISSDGDVVVQPYYRSVDDYGELSLIFIDGELTHAVRRPAEELAAVTEEDRAVANTALRAIMEPTLYARVDLVRDDAGTMRLLELELVEPSLFFELAPRAAARLARAIARVL
jgi:hypothetical protein